MPKKKRVPIGTTSHYMTNAKRRKVSCSKPTGITVPKQTITWSTCGRCHARILNTDVIGFCCGQSDHLIVLPRYPEPLERLLTIEREVQKQSRKYNNAFAFSAVACTGTEGFHRIANGPSNGIVHGQVYQRMPNGNTS